MKELSIRILMAVIGGMFLWEAILDLTIWRRYVSGVVALVLSLIAIFGSRYMKLSGVE